MAITKKKEVMTSVKSFISGGAEEAKKEGVMLGNKRQITLTISPELLARVDAAAEKMGQTRAGFINMLLFKGLKDDEFK